MYEVFSVKQIFSFTVRNKILKSFKKGQAKNKNSPFEFIDMSVK